MQSLDLFSIRMSSHGWAMFENVIPPGLLEKLRMDLDQATEACRRIQIKNGLTGTDGTSHHILVFEKSFMEFLEKQYLHDYLHTFFQSNYILNSFGGVITEKNNQSYVLKHHRDVRTFTGECKLILNMILLLDDFTLENGATYLLSGSHKVKDNVSENDFLKKSDRLVGKAGGIALFDANVWHAAGQNQTEKRRRAITLTWSKGLVKPQFDFISFFGEERVRAMPAPMRQVLGFNARVPRSLDEWYQLPENRMYKPGQD